MDQIKIGDFLKELRKSKKLTQQEAADSLFVSQKTISRWETGEGIPDISIILDVAKFYNVTVDEILEGKRKIESNKTEKVIIENYEQNNISKLNIYFFITISLILFFFILGIIFYFTLTKVIMIIILPITWIIGIFLYVFGYNENKDKIEDNDKQKIRRKTIMLSDIIFVTLIVYLLFLGDTFL